MCGERCLGLLLPGLVQSPTDKMLILFLGVAILLSVAGFQVTDPLLGGKEIVDGDLC